MIVSHCTLAYDDEKEETGGVNLVVYVTEFWKIILMVVPETIRIFDFTMVLLTAENTSNISEIFLVIQSIYS